MPVAPTLPISSLSTSRQQVVYSVFSTSTIARREVNAHTRSSCPYAMIILVSNPDSLAFPAGTTSSSADKKSSSSISYFSFRIERIFFATASFSSPFNGWLPTRISNASPSITSVAFLLMRSWDKWIKRSVTQKTGSFSSSPTQTGTTSPSFFTITP